MASRDQFGERIETGRETLDDLQELEGLKVMRGWLAVRARSEGSCRSRSWKNPANALTTRRSLVTLGVTRRLSLCMASIVSLSARLTMQTVYPYDSCNYRRC